MALVALVKTTSITSEIIKAIKPAIFKKLKKNLIEIYS